MSKAHRGKGIRDQFAHGRGECPVCKRKNVKILYEQEAEGQKFKICKICRAAIKHGKKSLTVAVAEEVKAAEETAAPAAKPAPEPAQPAKPEPVETPETESASEAAAE